MANKRKVNKLLIASMSAVIGTTTIPSITLASVNDHVANQKVTQVNHQIQSNKESSTESVSKKTGQKTPSKVTENTYTIVSGDSLSKIALHFNTTVTNLMVWNNLKTDLIYAGQKLNVSEPQATVKTVAKVNKVTTKKITTKALTTDHVATNTKTYTVVTGDSLSKIALHFNTTVENLKTWNNLNSDLIFIGQKMNVSKPSSLTQKVVKKSSATTKEITTKPITKKTITTNERIYTVVSGDSLSKIASNSNITVENLMSWNNLKTDLIYVGQKLNVSIPKSIHKTTENSSLTTNSKKIISTSSVKSSNTTTYTINRGDTLQIIAKVYNVTIENLKIWNGLTSDMIYVGQKIKIEKPKKVTIATKSSLSPQSVRTKHYTVQSGDSLMVIGKVYGVTVEELKNWNSLKSDLIYVGQKLIVKK